MRFARPEIFQWFWLIASCALFFLWMFRRKKKLMMRFAGKFVPELAGNFSSRKSVLKNIVSLGFLFFCLLALARPQWGFKLREVTHQGLDIVVVIDTSKSMLTPDVKPNRLERTKLAVKDLLKQLKGDRIGLVAFAGDAFLMCPLTADYDGFRMSLDELTSQTIPRGGTNVGAAIKEAVNGYAKIPAKYKVVILLTDGENLEGDPMAAAQEAKQAGIKIYTIGIGTHEGEQILVDNDHGKSEFLKDANGNFVRSKLDETVLREIAQTTDGIYAHASSSESGLELIYEKVLSKMEKREIEGKMEKKYIERFQFPLGFALLLLISESCLGTRKRA